MKPITMTKKLMTELVERYDSIIARAEKEKNLIEILPKIKELDKKITQFYVLVSKEQDNG